MGPIWAEETRKLDNRGKEDRFGGFCLCILIGRRYEGVSCRWLRGISRESNFEMMS